MILHLVAFGPARGDRLEQLASACGAGDVLVLLEEGRGFSEEDTWPRLVASLPKDVRLHVLVDDGPRLEASDEQPPYRLDMDGLVKLTEEIETCASWYP